MHFGPIRWVFLDDFNLVKEAYKREEINYRSLIGAVGFSVFLFRLFIKFLVGFELG